jgi:succinyl-diaminopimelate desuccinylase
VAEKHANIFGKNDLFLIPDYGNAASELIDVAEKSVLWLKITVTGKQCHAAWPVRGNNSLVASAAFILKAKSLHDTFGDKDKLFDIPYSTFTPTKKENNVGSVNIMPGRDVFYMDCRVLPHYKLEDVIAAVNKIGKEIAKEYGVEISCEAVQSVQSVEKMSTDSEILKRLVPSIRSVYKNNPNPMGVSCFTVALGLRRAGHTVAVWATLEEMAHQPNETGSIAATIGDAKVLASVLLG